MVTCSACSGSGETKCPCEGTGRVVCGCNQGMVTCPTCKGLGSPDGGYTPCLKCDWRRMVPHDACDGTGIVPCDHDERGMVRCPICGGTGQRLSGGEQTLGCFMYLFLLYLAWLFVCHLLS